MITMLQWKSVQFANADQPSQIQTCSQHTSSNQITSKAPNLSAKTTPLSQGQQAHKSQLLLVIILSFFLILFSLIPILLFLFYIFLLINSIPPSTPLQRLPPTMLPPPLHTLHTLLTIFHIHIHTHILHLKLRLTLPLTLTLTHNADKWKLLGIFDMQALIVDAMGRRGTEGETGLLFDVLA